MDPDLDRRDTPRNPTGEECSGREKHVLNMLFIAAPIVALVLSIVSFVDVYDGVDYCKESKQLENSLGEQMEAFANFSNARIPLLAREVKELKSSLTKQVTDLKTSFDTSMNKLREELLDAQSHISDVNADVDALQKTLANIQDSMKTEHSKVWAKFKELEDEIKNLPRSGGHSWKYIGNYHRNIVVTIGTVVFLILTK